MHVEPLITGQSADSQAQALLTTRNFEAFCDLLLKQYRMFKVTEMAGAIGYAASASALHYDNGDAALCRIKTHCKQKHTSKALLPFNFRRVPHCASPHPSDAVGTPSRGLVVEEYV